MTRHKEPDFFSLVLGGQTISATNRKAIIIPIWTFLGMMEIKVKPPKVLTKECMFSDSKAFRANKNQRTHAVSLREISWVQHPIIKQIY